MERDFLISSSATSAEEIGNPVHPGTASRLAREGISTAGKYAVQLKRTDYDRYDYFLGMDQWNVRNMKRILGEIRRTRCTCCWTLPGGRGGDRRPLVHGRL